MNNFQPQIHQYLVTDGVYPHNHELGAEIFNGKLGKAPLKYRLANLFSGRIPSSHESTLLMCVARKAIDKRSTYSL